MTLDNLLGYIGIGVSTFFGLTGLVVGVWAVLDGRRERSKREAAVNVVHSIVGRTEGLLIGLKTSVASMPTAIAAVDDGLDAIKIAKKELSNL